MLHVYLYIYIYICMYIYIYLYISISISISIYLYLYLYIYIYIYIYMYIYTSLPLFIYRYFYYVHLFFENCSIFLDYFFTDVFVITWAITCFIIVIIINKYLCRANTSVVILYTKLYTIYTLLSWRPCKT